MITAVERHAWVHVNVNQLIQNAERAGVAMTKHDADKVLRMWGFSSCGDNVWLCSERSLMLLQDDEVKSKRILGRSQSQSILFDPRQADECRSSASMS